jgi:hypothetical protein
MSYNSSEAAAVFDKNEANEVSLPHEEIERNLFLDENFVQDEKEELSQAAHIERVPFNSFLFFG